MFAQEGGGLETANAILRAVGLAAEHIGSPTWADHIPQVLDRLATATAASRAYVYENELGMDGILYTSQRHEYVAEGIASQARNPSVRHYPLSDGFLRWTEILRAGRVLQGTVADFPANERPFLQARSIHSLVIVPIFVAGRWWGFIGFDDCVDERRWSETEIQALRAAANIFGAAVQGERLKRLEGRLIRMATHDDLTGLPNRRALRGYIRHEHARAERSGIPYCLGLFDVDRFKLVNDVHGHTAGDQVLRQVASALYRSVRQGDWLGRWGGEEFLICLPATAPEQGFRAMERMRQAVQSAGATFEGRRIEVTVSAGLAVYVSGVDSVDDVLARADAGLYEAKLQGRNQIRATDVHQARTLSIAGLVQNALRAGLLVPAFQPIVDLATRCQVAEETLARILTSEGQEITAATFIEIADRLQVLHHIDDRLCRLSLERCSGRASQDRPVKQFVNLSGDLLRRPDLVRTLAHDVDHGCSQWYGSNGRARPIIIQITERESLGDAQVVKETLAPFLEHGFRLAIDDFGGGYSSFRYLADLPVSFLKIDRELITHVATDPRARSIVSSIQYTADSLGITTIAECIEEEETAQVLTDLGVQWGQGFLFGRPCCSQGWR